MLRQVNYLWFFLVVILIGSAFLLFSGSQIAFATFNSSSTSFKASDQNVSDIGGNTTSTSFRLYQNVGQASVGDSSSTNFKVRAGVLYWDTTGITSTPTPTPTTSQTVTSGGGGGGIVSTSSISPIPSVVTGVTPAITPKVTRSTCDFNNDGFCNIVDLSILLYWYGKTGPQITRYDLNSDKKIDLKDISILFYHWREE
ncbi:MAG: hypothetical protein Q8L47_00170 [bacterium]|nr:hypothetical protein [bacterium]